MNLSFSTRGWPDLTWDEMVDTALDMGFSGIEVYNLPKFNNLFEKGGPFHQYQTAATVRALREKKLTVPCFDTSCDLSADPAAELTVALYVVQVVAVMADSAHTGQRFSVIGLNADGQTVGDGESLTLNAISAHNMHNTVFDPEGFCTAHSQAITEICCQIQQSIIIHLITF